MFFSQRPPGANLWAIKLDLYWMQRGRSYSIRDHGISCDVLEHIQPGVPNLWAWMGISCQISTNIRLEIKCTINAMCLNHPETIPLLPWSMKILSSCNQFLVPKILRTADIQDVNFGWVILRGIYARLLP